jgi:hypothetical protein
VLSDRNCGSLLCRLEDVQLHIRENSVMGLGRFAGEAQQETGSWPGSAGYSTAVHQVESPKPRISRENQLPQVQIEPGNRLVRQSLIHIIGNLPPLLDRKSGTLAREAGMLRLSPGVVQIPDLSFIALYET